MAVDRRQFLKTASLAASAAALSQVERAGAQKPASITISGTPYAFQPGHDYPIRPIGFSDVTLSDTFWKPKVDVNARVTIPLEVHKFVDGEREFGGNILEAAIMSL